MKSYEMHFNGHKINGTVHPKGLEACSSIIDNLYYKVIHVMGERYHFDS